MELALQTITAGGVVGILIQLWLTHDVLKSHHQFVVNKIEELESAYWGRYEEIGWHERNGGDS